MSIGATLFKRVDARPDAYAWIGLDFGTATTECVVRVEVPGENDRIAAVAFGGSERENARVVVPSAMELLDGLLVPAHEVNGRGRLVENMKRALLAEIHRVDPSQLRRLDGPFCLSMLHVASMLAVARTAVARWMRGARVRYYLNVATPVGASQSDSRNAKVRDVFRELGFRALVMSEEWSPHPISRDKAISLARRTLSLPTPTADLSPVAPVPEALAAVTSFLNAADRRAGNFATIDIGGGTTDISYFWYQTGEYDAAHERKAWYYSVRSVPIGTSDLVAGLSSSSSAVGGITSHERLKTVVNPEQHIDHENLKGFFLGLDHSYREAFREAFRLRPIHKEWCHDSKATWTLLLLGGGCGFEFIRSHLQGSPPRDTNIPAHGAVCMLTAPSNLPILLPDGTVIGPPTWARSRDVMQVNGHLLTVAHGLAHRAPDFPRYGEEHPIKPPPAPPAWEPPPHTVHN